MRRKYEERSQGTFDSNCMVDFEAMFGCCIETTSIAIAIIVNTYGASRLATEPKLRFSMLEVPIFGR